LECFNCHIFNLRCSLPISSFKGDYPLVVTLKNIQEAKKAIIPFIKCTPLVQSQFLTNFCGCPLFLKLENLQITSSFKPRGVFNKLLHLSAEEKKQGHNHSFCRQSRSSSSFRRAKTESIRKSSCANKHAQSQD